MTSTSPQSTPYASASLYVGDLDLAVSEALLFEIFNAVGPVASVRVCRDAATRRSLGYAYVNFHQVNDAERALDTMNFTSIRGKPCRIMWSHRDPSLRKSGLGNIFVKNLAPSIDNKTMFDTFSVFGNILSCKVAMSRDKVSLGYGFVHYESQESAEQAIAEVNGNKILDQQVTVQPFKPKSERGGTDKFSYTNVYVKNLPEDFTKEKLEELFSKHGDITSSMVSTDTDGKCKPGFGFVNFAAPEMATAAVEALNGLDMGDDKKLTVCRAQKKAEREKELRKKFEHLKAERQKKFEGVNLYVKNLSDDLTDDKLKETFAKFGSITSCKVMTNPKDGRSKGFGFVCFSTNEEATKAVTAMNGHMMDGKPLYVALAQRKEDRRAQLEAQYAARNKFPAMYAGPQAGAPMFYQGAGAPMPRGFMYPPQMMQQRRWQGNQMMGGGRGHPQMGYQLLPATGGGRGGPGRGGRGGRGRRKQGGRNQGPQGQTNVKYGANVRNQQQPQGQTQDSPQKAMVSGGPAPLTVSDLAAADPQQQKQMMGERLYPLIHAQDKERAGKITGMLLEMDNGELLHLLESPAALNDKVKEALSVLQEHSAATGQAI